MFTKTNERDINVSVEEYTQHHMALEALNIIHCCMGTDTNKGRFLRYKRALNKANQIGDMAPIVQMIFESVDCFVDLEVAEIYAQATYDKINERGVFEIDYTDLKERRLDEQGGKCANPQCGTMLTYKTAQVGHIIPKKLVGNTLGDDNIQAVCKCCNSKNHTNYNVRAFITNRKLNHI